MDNIAVLWDIENMIPSSKNDVLDKINSFLEHNLGQAKYSYAVANWNNIDKTIAQEIYKKGFEMIHIPVPEKNLGDQVLIKKANEIMVKHPEINCYVIISSDSDYKLMMEQLKESGKKVCVLFNAHRIKTKYNRYIKSNTDLAVAI